MLAPNSFCSSNKDEKTSYKRADIFHGLTGDSNTKLYTEQKRTKILYYHVSVMGLEQHKSFPPHVVTKTLAVHRTECSATLLQIL